MSHEKNAPSNIKLRKIDLNHGLNHGDERIISVLNELESVQTRIVALDDKAHDEKQAVSRKYDNLKRSLYQSRSNYIKNIPYFWERVFYNNSQLSSLVSEDENDCFKYLTNLEVEEGSNNYKIHFFFNENPIIENKKLTKEILYDKNMDCTTKSTPILWKDSCSKVNQATTSKGRKRNFEERNLLEWFEGDADYFNLLVAQAIRTEIWQNPALHFKKGLVEGKLETDDCDVWDEDNDSDELLKELMEDVNDSDDSSDEDD
uniref:Protein SET n=1 Tax=Graphocephala atropunctata TaxID=36148 RepID=A0A1B6KWF9_9HEMI